MAILMDTEIFTCSCGCMEFKVDEVKSFIYGQKFDDKDVLYQNTNRKVLVCITCGKNHDPRNLNFSIIETGE